MTHSQITDQHMAPRGRDTGPRHPHDSKSTLKALANPEGGGGQGVRPPLKNHRNRGFLCNTGPDSLKHHKATKLAFYVGPTSARQRNAIKMAFRWRADDGPFIAVFGFSIPSTKQKKQQKKQKNRNKHHIWTPSDKTFWIRAFKEKQPALSSSTVWLP